MSRWLERQWEGEVGGWPMATTALLAPLALAFRATTAARNALFDAGVLRAHRVTNARVVSVGNLTVGGSGKTPAVIFLAQWGLACGQKVAVVSRGYGRHATEDVVLDANALPAVSTSGDEPRLIARRCPGARVFVGLRREALVSRAAAEGATLILLDDGFQRRGVARDVDLVVIDGSAPAVRRPQVLPLGPFRELPSALARASAVWLIGPAPAWLPGVLPRIEARHEVVALRSPTGAETAPSSLRGQPVVALCGIGRPERFARALRELGANLIASFEVADHAAFPDELLANVRAAAREGHATVVTTEKDAERLPPEFEASRACLGVRVATGLEPLAQLLGLDPRLVPPQGV